MHIDTDRTPDRTTDWLRDAARAAREASAALARMPESGRNDALRAAAAALRAGSAAIVAANATRPRRLRRRRRHRRLPRPARPHARPGRGDGAGAGRRRRPARPARPHAGRLDAAERTCASGASPPPIGVIGMIYESRPNVGADAAGLCLKSGNAVILRGGSDSFHSAARDPRRGDRGPARRRRARRRGAGAARHRPRLCRRHAGRRRADRPDHPARRQGPGGARAGARRGCRCWPMPRGSATPTSTRPPTRRWRGGSSPTPRCAAPASAAPPRRC